MTIRMHWGPIALVLVLAASGCSDDDTGREVGADGRMTTSADNDVPEFTEGDCPSPIPVADGFRCGTVTVPLHRDEADSATIDLAVAVLPAPEPGLHDDPVVVIDHLEPTLAGYEGHAALPDRVERDVVLFDIRGMGRSQPSLECTEVDYRLSLSDTDAAVRQRYLDELDACRARLESDGVDLTAYTLGAIADDIIDIRRALGYKTWNVIGYGQVGADPGVASSEVVYELMRRDGDAIRSVTMEAPTPPQQDPWSTQVGNVVRAVDEIINACTEQPRCAAAYPTLRDDLAAAFQRGRSEHPATSGEGDPMTVVFDPAWMGVYLSVGIGTIDLMPLVPAVLTMPPEEAADVIAATTTKSSPDNLAIHGVLLSALCPLTGADSTPADRSTPNDFDAVGWSVYVERDSCEHWGVRETDSSFDEPVISDIPTLLLVGQFDPQNTIAGARLLASTLTNAHVYEIPAATTNPLGSSDCARQIRNSFVQDPGQEPDSSCLTTVPTIQFAT